MGKDCREENRQIWKAMEEFLAERPGQGDRRVQLRLRTTSTACCRPARRSRWSTRSAGSSASTRPTRSRTCAEHDIVVEAYSPFAHGLIVNHPEIGDIAARYGVSAPQLCIRYLLQKGAVVLPKATSTAHIEQNAQLDFEISAADMGTSSTPCATPRSTRTAMEFRWS